MNSMHSTEQPNSQSADLTARPSEELLSALAMCRNALLAAGVGRVSQMARDAIDAATAILGDGAPDA